MQRFRPALTTELDRRLDTVTGADQADHTPDAAAGLIDWLARQRVGRLLTHESDITVIDLPTGFDAIMTDPVVARVFREHFPEADHPDMSHGLAGDHHGRPVTQAISAAVHALDPLPGGIAYPSRRDTNKTCWAVFIHVSVWPESDDPLSPHDPEHVTAVRSVCARYGIPAPTDW